MMKRIDDRTYTPIFDFQMLFDTDFGIMSLIASEMQDIDLFDHEWINAHRTNKQMIKALYERTDKNPLIQATVPNRHTKEEIDELYNSFITDEEYYKKVISKSMPTEIYSLLGRCFEMGDIYPSILYRNDIELSLIKEMDYTNRITESNLIRLDDLIAHPKKYKKGFSQMYCKHKDDDVVLALASLYAYAKTFYIADYPFNNNPKMGSGTIDISGEGLTIAVMISRSEVRSIDIYNRGMLEE